MTIQAQGHVEAMEQGTENKIKLRIYNSKGEPLVIEATREELGGLYLPGTSVQITVQPLPPAPLKEPGR
jgi:hypothetical protein